MRSSRGRTRSRGHAAGEHVITRLVDNEEPIPVVDADGHYCGAISKGRLNPTAGGIP